MSLCAAAVLIAAPACRDRQVSPRQPERAVLVADSTAAATASPTPTARAKLTPPPARLPKQSSVSGGAVIKAYIRKVFGAHADKAISVARCESVNWNADVIAGRRLGALGEIGVFQMRPEFHAWRAKAVGGTSLYDWRTNVRAAFHLFSERGWEPWTCA